MKSDVSDIFWLEENRTLQYAPAGEDRRLMQLDLASPYYAMSPANPSTRTGRGDVLSRWRKHRSSIFFIEGNISNHLESGLSLSMAENLEDLVSGRFNLT